jgi:carbon storage regulator
MLVLTRGVGQEIVIDGDIRVTVLGIQGNKIRLGVNAPPIIRVDRAEVHKSRCAKTQPQMQLQEVH